MEQTVSALASSSLYLKLDNRCLVCLLAKKVQGERPIPLLTMPYRIWSRTRKHFEAEWCDTKAGFWNDAVRGSAPLQAALRRLVADELTQHTDNRGACSVIWCGKFLRFHLFVSGGTGWIETGIPPVLLGLALLHLRRGSFPNRRMQWVSGLRSGQSRCKTGALRHLGEVARAAPVHHDCAMGGRFATAHASSAE